MQYKAFQFPSHFRDERHFVTCVAVPGPCSQPLSTLGLEPCRLLYFQSKSIGKVFNSQQSFHPISNPIDWPLYQAQRTEWLAWFCNMGGVCWAWLGPPRTVFWEEMTLFTVPELVDFTCAIDEDSAKPACIRRLYFRFPDTCHMRCSPSNSVIMKDEVQHFFPVTLRCLPTHLDVLMSTVLGTFMFTTRPFIIVSKMRIGILHGPLTLPN